MYVIALVGGNNCGKTTTLNMVYDNVMRKDGTTSVIPKQPLGHQKVRALYNDFSSGVSFMRRQIMFYTMGDYADIGDDMAKYSGEGFDMFVCAINTGLVRPFVDIRKYDNTQIHKTTAIGVSERETANTKDAEKIYSLICELADS